MEALLAPCRACGEEIPAASRVCPACAYDLNRHNRLRLSLGAVGTVLTLTVVLAPIGLPLVWLATRHRGLAEGTVTQHQPKSLPAHMLAVIRHHAGLEAPAEPMGDFTRGGSDTRPRFDRPPKL